MSWDDNFVAARWSDQKWGKESQLRSGSPL